MKPVWTLTLLLSLVSSASADIAPDPLGGGASISRRPKGSKTMVAMVHEIVRISVSQDAPSFHVTFRMKNTANQTEAIQVGFPSNYKDELLNFSASINGMPVSVEHIVDSYQSEGALGTVTYRTYWHVWPMQFQPKKRSPLTFGIRRKQGLVTWLGNFQRQIHGQQSNSYE